MTNVLNFSLSLSLPEFCFEPEAFELKVLVECRCRLDMQSESSNHVDSVCDSGVALSDAASRQLDQFLQLFNTDNDGDT